MIALGFLLLLVVIVAVSAAVGRSAVRTSPPRPPALGRDDAAGSEEPAPPGTPVSAHLAAALERWRALGLLSDEQAAAIVAHEASLATDLAPVPPAPPGEARPRRTPAAAEALGYLGGMLAVIGLVLVVTRYWPNMALAAKLALSGAGALALLGAGAIVNADVEPALDRLRGFLWLASTAALALFAGVVAADGIGVDRRETIALACSAAVALESGLLWGWRDRPLQQLTTLGGTAVLVGAAVAHVASVGFVGLATWAVGAGYLFAGLRRRTPGPTLTVAGGALAVLIGAGTTAAEWAGAGLLLALATAFVLLALATVEGMAPSRADQLVAGLFGGVALFQAGPSAIGYFAEGAGVMTGLTTWVIGGALVVVGSRQLVRLAIGAQVLGGAGIIGGAALTGVQWHGFAPLFGIATAVGLVALGMRPGHSLLSVFGSLGLLVNVPWAIGWYFPGEGRAPLLIMVSGAMILVVAVLMARMGGRFRRELRHPRRRPPATRAAPHDP